MISSTGSSSSYGTPHVAKRMGNNGSEEPRQKGAFRRVINVVETLGKADEAITKQVIDGIKGVGKHTREEFSKAGNSENSAAGRVVGKVWKWVQKKADQAPKRD